MLFGNRENFGIEVELDKDYGGAWLYGKFCYWINGIQVGDYELGTSLRDALIAMKWIVYDCGKRDGEILCNMPPQEIFIILDNALYAISEDEIDKSKLPDTPARFNVCINIDVFFGWKIFLIECSEMAKIIFKQNNNPEINLFSLPKDLFDSAIKSCYDYLDKLDEREKS
jgi:hypothetical protein